MSDRIVIVSASIGAGHDGVAGELAVRLEALGFEVEIVDFLDLLPGVFGVTLRQTYAWQLRRAPLTWDVLYGALERYPGLAYASVRLTTALAGARTERLVDTHTVAVVSTYPLASQVLGWLRRQGRLSIPVATFLCDMSVHPLWVADGVDAHLAMHKIPADQARYFGARGITITAPVVKSGFLTPPGITTEVARARFGLPTGVRIALVLAGSWGVGEIAQTTVDIAGSGLAMPVVVCGHNADLRHRLRESGVGVALGWVDHMPDLIRAADVVVHNAGGLSCMEALAVGTPVITYRPLSGHGRTNVAALAAAGLVVHADEPDELYRLLRESVIATESAMTAGAANSLWGATDAANAVEHLAASGACTGQPAERSHPERAPRR